MPNTIYVTSPLKSWIAVSKRLHERHDLTPVLWLGCHSKREAMHQFPDVVMPTIEQMWNKGWTDLGTRYSSALPENAFKELHGHWDSLMSMCIRSGWSDLSYQTKRHRIYGLYAFFMAIIRDSRVQCVFFAESPHKISSYLLYIAAKACGIPTPMFVRAGFPGYIFLTNSIGGMPEGWPSSSRESGDNQFSLSQHPIIQRYLDDLASKPASQTVPHYMKEQRERKGKWHVQKIRAALVDPRNSLPRRVYNVVRASIKAAFYPMSTKSRLLNNIQDTYEKLATGKPNSPFVLVALHYQPERTTNPDGRRFDDQLLMIRQVASCVPPGWVVYVKEHQSQFYHFMNGDKCRNEEFYESLRSLDNVRFAPVDILGLELVSTAKGVVTVTGTIGFEAAARGVPVAACGLPWYSGCPGVTNVETPSDMEQWVQSLAESKSDETQSMEHYFECILSYCTRAFVHLSDRPRAGLSDEELTLNLGDALENWYRSQFPCEVNAT